MASTEIVVTFIAASILFLILAILIVGILGLYQRRQIRYLQEKNQLKAQYEKAITESQLEIQNQTLQHVGQDLHDNIGQLLALARMQLSNLEVSIVDTELQEQVIQTYEVVGEAINEVRALTKSLDGEFIKKFRLEESISHELQRIQKTLRIQTQLFISNPLPSLDFRHKIILFRVIQELINNTIKHAKASLITVAIDSEQNQIKLTMEDNGRGFDYESVMKRSMSESGAGLRNIANRLALIGGTFAINTRPDRGTHICIIVQTSTTTTNTEPITS